MVKYSADTLAAAIGSQPPSEGKLRGTAMAAAGDDIIASDDVEEVEEDRVVVQTLISKEDDNQVRLHVSRRK